jgi:hypothetical protein
VEDVVVSHSYRGLHLGEFLIRELVTIAKLLGVYKVVISDIDYF